MPELNTSTPESLSHLEDYEYDLPLALVAQEPLAERTTSKLMHLDKKTGDIAHAHFKDIVDLLQPGDTVVLNDTKVIPARLIAKRHSGGTVKLLLLKAEVGAPNIWQAMVTPIKRLKPGERLEVTDENGTRHTITIIDLIIGFDGFKRLIVDLGPPEKVWQLLSSVGYAPLPPYIQRRYGTASEASASEGGQGARAPERAGDLNRYQTVFAREPGAVAAPTAGLHFSKELLDIISKRGVNICYITLHVGAGTFKPISTSVDEHQIEPELFSISEQSAQMLNQCKKENHRIIAVGTTSLRALETAAKAGLIEAVQNGVTSLYIKPGHRFQMVDALITNFHLSKSSLLVLVAAFAGREKIMHAYKEAIKERYRFYSYGDAMLIT